MIYEQIRLQLNLSNMKGQIEYFNIVSTIEKKDSYWQTDIEKEEFFTEMKQIRKDDLKDLLKEFNDYESTENKQILSKKLVEKEGQLNALEKFKLMSLEEYDLSIDPNNSSYIMKIDANSQLVNSNGAYLETDSGNFVRWNSDTKKIDITIRLIDLDQDCDHTESMLGYWLEWKKSN